MKSLFVFFYGRVIGSGQIISSVFLIYSEICYDKCFHYLPEVSLTPYEALLTYTVNGARMLGELEHSGTLEAGKDADFFTADWDINRVTAADVPRLCAEEMYVRGRRWRKKQGTVGELLTMLMQLPHKI